MLGREGVREGWGVEIGERRRGRLSMGEGIREGWSSWREGGCVEEGVKKRG